MNGRVSTILSLLLVCSSGAALADTPAAGNLIGQRGMLRMSSAANQPSGVISIGTVFQGFSSGDFLAKGEDHSRMINSYAINWAVFRYVEAALALHVTSDQSTVGSAEPELMVAVGDPELSFKGGAELGGGVSVGGLFDLRFPAGSGFFEPSAGATSFLIAALASWSPKSLPLGVHLNLGFFYDGSENLFDKPGDLSAAQVYAAQLSSFHRVVTRLGVEYNSRYVGPFLELSLEPFMGDGAPGFGDSPGILSLGARVWPTKSKSFQLLAAADIGLTGVSTGEARSLPADKYAFVLPRWNILVGLAYRFDAYAREPTVGGGGENVEPPPPVVEKPKTGVVEGDVVDAQTNKPIWNAAVSVAGEESSSLAVDPKDGTFKTYRLPVGPHTVVARADGYAPAEAQVQVTEDGTARATLRLSPKTTVVPGTLRGTIKALVGKSPKSSTILIPELDRTVEVDEGGVFSIQLKPGEYKVVVSAPGFRSQTKRIRVMEGSTVILNVELHK